MSTREANKRIGQIKRALLKLQERKTLNAERRAKVKAVGVWLTER